MRIARGLILVGVAAGVLNLEGCAPTLVAGVFGNNVPGTVTRSLGAFTEIVHYGIGLINITIGDTQSVQISGDANLLPFLGTTVTNGQLTIRPLVTSMAPQQPLVYTITMTDLTALALLGAGSATVSGLDNESLAVALNGAGHCTVAGQTELLNATLTGAGSFDARQLTAIDAVLFLAGAGNADVTVTDQLNVTLTGVGSVTYAGDPQVTHQVTGVGTVTQRSE